MTPQSNCGATSPAVDLLFGLNLNFSSFYKISCYIKILSLSLYITFRTEGRQDNRATKIMKTSDGYRLRKNQSGGFSDYEILIFEVDACNFKGDPKEGLFDREHDGRYPTLAQAVAHCKKYKDTCDMFEIWEEWHDYEINKYGDCILDVNSQIVHQYKKGKFIGKDQLL